MRSFKRDGWVRGDGLALGVALAACLLIPAHAIDKSGVKPETISLPTGPGSIEGLGEDFEPHLNTGTASYRVPLRVPAGTAGHAPEIGLSYEGGSGNGCLGIGWSLNVPSIRRQCEKGIPAYEPNNRDDDFDGLTDNEGEDRFLDPSGEELVPMPAGYYFPENQGSFVRTWKKGDGWEDLSPNGTKRAYGQTEASRIVSQDGRIYRWFLSAATDTNGNVVQYIHDSFAQGEDLQKNLNQKYLKEIRYGPGAPPWDVFYSIVFEYENREDVTEDYRSAFAVRTGKRLRSIGMALQGNVEAELGTLDGAGHLISDLNNDGAPDALVRRYELEYDAHPHWSLLTAVHTVAADDSRWMGPEDTDKIPPARFRYPIREIPGRLSASDFVIGGINEPLKAMDNPIVDLVDLNGDGLPDVLETDGVTHLASLNEGVHEEGGAQSIEWGNPITVDATNTGSVWPLSLSNEVTGSRFVHLSDVDGDGLADFVRTPGAGAPPYYFRNQGNVSWGPYTEIFSGSNPPPAPYMETPNAQGGVLKDNIEAFDVDFDKRVDIVQSLDGGGGFLVWYQLGPRETKGAPTTAEYGFREEAGAFFSGSPALFSGEGFQLADLTGDRVLDVAQVFDDGIQYAVHQGYGLYEEDEFISLKGDDPSQGPDTFQGLTDLRDKAKLTDVTGDGLADLVVLNLPAGEIWYWVNLGYREFDYRRIIDGLPENYGQRTVDTRWADMNGNGTTDLVYSNSQLPNGQKIKTLDIGALINGSDCPNLLIGIENGIGRSIELEYRPTTYYAARDARDGDPWKYPVPNPVNVVSKITTRDGLGHSYVTEIEYHDGYYDGVEKEFRGFESSEQIDVGDPTAPTLVTHYEFDVGDLEESLKGKALRMVTRTEDGKVFSEQSSEWAVRTLHSLPPNPDPFEPTGVDFPYLVSTFQTVLEEPTPGDHDPVFLAKEYGYDDYGNKVLEADYGQVLDDASSMEEKNHGNDERITWTVFSATPDAPIWNAPVDTILTDNADPPRLVSRNQSFYDGEPFQGLLPLGSIDRGNLTRSRDWVGAFDSIDPPNPLPQPEGRFLNVVENVDRTFSFEVIDEGGATVGNEADRWIDSIRSRYNEYGNIVAIADPLAVVSAKGTDDSVGHYRNLAYDPDLRTYPIEETVFTGEGNSLSMRVGYDLAFGTIVESFDFNDNRTEYGYDEFARILAIASPGGTVPDTLTMPTLGFDYRLANLVDTSEGADEGVVNWIETRMHEEFGDPDAYFVSRTFVDGLGREVLTKQEDERPDRTVVSSAKTYNARRTEYESLLPYYSGDGLEFEDINAPGFMGTWILDGATEALSFENAPRTKMLYDATGREVSLVQPDESFTLTEYLPLVRRVFDEEDTQEGSKHFDTPMVYTSDGLERLIGVDEVVKINDNGTPRDDATPWRTAYQYDLLDNLTHILDSQDNEKFMLYDAIKRKVYMDDPDRGRMWYEYDDASNLLGAVDAKDQEIVYAYDGANRLVSEDYLDEGNPFSYERTPDVSFHYDEPAPGGPIDFGDLTEGTGENLKGYLSYVVDLVGQEHNSYDARGNVKWVVRSIPDPVTGIPVPYKTETEYDAADRVVELFYPDNDRITYAYNDRNLPESIPTILDRIDYAPSSQILEMVCGNGVVSGYEYDNRLRLTSLSHISANQGNQELVNYSYDFDAASNILAIHDHRPAEEVPLDSERRNTQLFEYDSLYRLTKVRYPRAGIEPATPTIDYRYDRIGNMLFKSSPIGRDRIVHKEEGQSVVNLGRMDYGGASNDSMRSGRVGRSPGEAPGPHALTGTQSGRFYKYDDNGNMNLIDGASCEWDYKDRLVHYRKGTIEATYVYDYTDRRQVKIVTNATGTNHVLYPYESFEIREFDTPKKYVWKGDQRIAKSSHRLDETREIISWHRLLEGWNFVTVGIEMSDMTIPAVFGQVDSVWGWDGGAEAHFQLAAMDTITPGSAYWVLAPEDVIQSWRGEPVGYQGRPLPSGRHLLAWPGPDRLDLDSLEAEYCVWNYDQQNGQWRLRTNQSEQSFINDLPPIIGPGSAFWVDVIRGPDESSGSIVSGPDYFHSNHLSSIEATTSPTGATNSSSVYYPFGFRRNHSSFSPQSTPYAFLNREFDIESQLSHLGARYQTGSVGRFVSVDPVIVAIGRGDKDSRKRELRVLQNPQYLNVYSYSLNHPQNYLDDSGEMPQAVAGALLGAAVELVSQYIHHVVNADFDFSLGRFADEGLDLGNVGWSAAMGLVNPAQSVAKALSGELLEAGAEIIEDILTSLLKKTLSGALERNLIESGMSKERAKEITDGVGAVVDGVLAVIDAAKNKNPRALIQKTAEYGKGMYHAINEGEIRSREKKEAFRKFQDGLKLKPGDHLDVQNGPLIYDSGMSDLEGSY